MESNTFLLSTSLVFDDANLIDCIRQSCIDLNESTDEILVIELLEEAINFLLKDIEYDVANELIALILKCFTCISTDILPHLTALFEKSKANSYLIISFISVLSYLANDKSDFDLSKFSSFIEDALKEIQPQIQNKSPLILFNHEIPFQFRDDLIFDLLLSTKPTDELLTDYNNFYTSKDISDNTKFKKFIKKYTDAGFGASILISLLTNEFSNKDDSKDVDDDEENVSNEPKEATKDEEPEEVDFITEFLSKPKIENDRALKKSLINSMLKDKSNMLGYFQIIFENISGPTTTPKDLLGFFINEYELSKEDFIKVLDNVLVLHPTKNVFIEQPKYKPLNLPDSELNRKVLKQLYSLVRKDPSNFSAFYCLECIANSFPFIFESNPKEVFEIVLPAFNNTKVIFENKKDKDDDDDDDDDEEEEEEGDDENPNKKNIRMGKASIAAISFLLFTLNSTKVFDAFIPWFFDNCKKMTLSQHLSFIIVFLTSSVSNFLHLIITYFKKYDIFSAINDILLKKVPKNLFGENFNYFLYSLLLIQHKLPDALDQISALLIDVNIEKTNIFFEGSGGRMTHSIDYISPVKGSLFYIDKNDRKHINTEPFDFIDENQNFKPSWSIKSRTQSYKITNQQVDEFIQLYKSLTTPKEAAEETKFPEITSKISVKKVVSLIKNSRWIYRYILVDKTFPLLVEHHRILSEIYPTLLDKSNEDEDDETIKDFSLSDFFSSYRESPEFLKNLLERLTNNFYRPSMQLSKYFQEIPFNRDDYEAVLKTINSNIKYIDLNRLYYEQSTYIDIRSNLLLLADFLQNLNKNSSINYGKFYNLIGNDLIDFALKPQSRKNNLILRIVYQLLTIVKEYPNRVLHIIGFMIISNNKYLKKSASKLCIRMDEKQLESLQIIEETLVKELDSDKPIITFVSNVLRSSASYGKAHRSELLELLKVSLDKCEKESKNKNNEEEEEEESKDDDDDDEDEDDKKEDVKLKDLVIQLLDILSPERDDRNSFVLSDSLISKKHPHDERFRFCPIPDFIYESSPQFWSVFEQHRPYINEILLKEFQGNEMIEIPGIIGLLLSLTVTQFSSRLVSNYPECFSYDFRSTFFHQLMHDELSFVNDLELEIDQENILDESFEKLHDRKPKDWVKRINITYNGNEGVDAGGITRDWFTKLTLELFNPNTQLFETSEKNQNYIPSRSLYAKSPEGLAKLRFTGMIIARALMQGILIPVHFTKSFLKQILHHERMINFKDLEDADEILFSSLEFYRNTDFDSEQYEMDVRFEVSDMKGDTIELIENGSQVKVNNENKEKYVVLQTEYRLINSIRDQVRAFCEGFDSLIHHNKIRMFTPTELSLLICGVPKIDIEDLKRNVEYKEPYNADSNVIQLFFSTISKWDDENLAKLLVFMTGTSRMPANGFVFFKQMDKPIRIVPGGDSTRLPCAHTCTNTLELPLYETEEELNSKLLTAINVLDFQIK